jgi:hypothetical protein
LSSSPLSLPASEFAQPSVSRRSPLAPRTYVRSQRTPGRPTDLSGPTLEHDRRNGPIFRSKSLWALSTREILKPFDRSALGHGEASLADTSDGDKKGAVLGPCGAQISIVFAGFQLIMVVCVSPPLVWRGGFSFSPGFDGQRPEIPHPRLIRPVRLALVGQGRNRNESRTW